MIHPKLYAHLTVDLGISLPGAVEGCPDSIPDDMSLVLSIGGDGTFLRTAAWTGATGVPILGINTGTLGYLSALSAAESVALADDILAGNYSTQPRALIAVEGAELFGAPYALNEVVFGKDDYTSIINVETEINGSRLADYRADGLIVSTPTGSTAYNLSVGGPIVQPDAPVWVIAPIAAHSLGMRPLVVSDNCTLTLTPRGRSKRFRVSIDGRTSLLPMGTTIVLRRAPFVINIVQSQCSRFPDVLHNKLLFS